MIVYCNFCGKSEDEVATIIRQNPNGKICNECAELAHAICLMRKHGLVNPPLDSQGQQEARD